MALLPSGCKKSAPLLLHALTINPIREDINPWTIRYAADFLIVSSVSSSFVELDENEKWSFPFCENWKQTVDANDTWICELSQDLHWSDGSVMSPEEIVDSLKESTRASHSNGVAALIKSIVLEKPRRVRIQFSTFLPNALWAFTGLDQAVLAPESRAEIRSTGTLHLKNGLKRSSGRYKLVSIDSGRVRLEPNPYFRVSSSRATLPIEIIGNLSIDEIEARLLRKIPGDFAQLQGGTLQQSTLSHLKRAGLQELIQPVPNVVTMFFFGKHAFTSMTKEERQYLFSSIASRMLESSSELGAPAFGLAPPSTLGALDLQSWKEILKRPVITPKRKLKIDLFVMKSLQSTPLYLKAKSVLDGLPIEVHEVQYDPEESSSVEWKRRSKNDYDMLFGYEESYSPDPDPFWRDVQRLSFSPQPLFSDIELNHALLEQDSKKRTFLYQNFERKSAEDPAMIPLRRFGNELFVAPGVDVGPQEAFGMMFNLWAFKAAR